MAETGAKDARPATADSSTVMIDTTDSSTQKKQPLLKLGRKRFTGASRAAATNEESKES